PHFASKVAVGFAAVVFFRDPPRRLSFAAVLRIASSISRYFVRSAFFVTRWAWAGGGVVFFGTPPTFAPARLVLPPVVPACRIVDEGIDPIPVRIPAMRNIDFSEGDRDVAVRVRGLIVPQGKLGTVQLNRHI